MKLPTYIFLALLPLSLLLSGGWAAGSPLQDIKMRRIENLTELHELLKTRHAAGEVQMVEVLEAGISLYTLQRDQIHEPARQLPWQEKILALETQRHSLISDRVNVGLHTKVELLRSFDRRLAAEQLLMELQWAVKSPK